ncbi:MAG TPA: glycosyltransferase [Pyrinomonadaceae bacterium]|nr:glycosyltransferase [Pyrinomonadaceae bacterium]
MRIVLNTFGSFGDVHPYMAIGMELQSRGHVAVIATMDGYREKVEDVGLEFAPVRPNISQPQDQNSDVINRIMEPKTGGRFLMDEIIFPAVRESYEDLIAAVAGADLLVTHPAAPAGPLVGRKLGMPWVSTVLAPLSFFSAYDFPVPPYWQWAHKITLLGPRFLRLFLDAVKSTYKAQPVTDLRNELELRDYGHPMFEGQHSPTLVLASVALQTSDGRSLKGNTRRRLCWRCSRRFLANRNPTGHRRLK